MKRTRKRYIIKKRFYILCTLLLLIVFLASGGINALKRLATAESFSPEKSVLNTETSDPLTQDEPTSEPSVSSSVPEVSTETEEIASSEVEPAFTEENTSVPATSSEPVPTPSVEEKPEPELSPEPSVEETIKLVEINGLVELTKLDDSFVIDLRYATENNFTGKKIYSMAKCLIHKNTAAKLIAANNEFKKYGYRIKIFDAYRPLSAQQILWDAASDKNYVANPAKGSNHNRGAAVDITLVDEEGKELEMPSAYDEFTKRAHLDYMDCPKEQIENRELLGKIMEKHGFRRLKTEWWHFDDIDAKKYPLLDVQFEEFP